MPALGAISLPGAWLLVRVPRSQPLAAITTLAVVAALFGLGGWAFHDMYQFPFGSQLVVVPGPGGTVELKPGPGAMIGEPGRVAPGGPRPCRPDAALWQDRCPDSRIALTGVRLRKVAANSECWCTRSARSDGRRCTGACPRSLAWLCGTGRSCGLVSQTARRLARRRWW